MKKYLLLLLATTFFTLSCKKPFNGGNTCDDVFCTGVFSEIKITVVDNNKKPVLIDEFYTIRTSTNDTIYNSYITLNITPYKVVLDDSYLPKFRNQRDVFRYLAFYKHRLVADQHYTISADCCHVTKESGPETIIVQ